MKYGCNLCVGYRQVMSFIVKIFFLYSLVFLSGQTLSHGVEKFIELDKDGIKVYVFSPDNSSIASFKAVTHINASIDSILAVMIDNKNYIEWVHACNKSLVIKDVSFNKRYHYQSIAVPFPFKNREFIFRSIIKHDRVNKTATVVMSLVPDYCKNNQSEQCKKINQSDLVRVRRSIGTYKLVSDNHGTKITWVQYTEPGGKLPNWLVNQFVKEIPYQTLKSLTKLVKQDQYKFSKLIYDNKGNAIALNTPSENSAIHPTF